uniref:ATP synthase complex subunit 8 n=1 Tax=Triplophysa langpingensis TaxID=3035871 RepID=A0A9Y1LXQ7_9TELE|nr:ATP synthase F0 subunit 8 [Triplophysa langpingensis]YP_010835759.1 ATP synthase F0 subunit 8 [Troglonectes lihuensis]WET58830.1 ATP synthase F0 subunit 8 [Triplophysa langpingensis]WGC44036.1 ATP synthase F0 subunit 8 [Troglonectes lihuensis]
MPQLNPAPWFAILVFSWLAFLTIIPTKVMNHTSPNEPTLLDSEKHKTEPWDWPWQ